MIRHRSSDLSAGQLTMYSLTTSSGLYSLGTTEILYNFKSVDQLTIKSEIPGTHWTPWNVPVALIWKQLTMTKKSLNSNKSYDFSNLEWHSLRKNSFFGSVKIFMWFLEFFRVLLTKLRQKTELTIFGLIREIQNFEFEKRKYENCNCEIESFL